MSRDEAWMRARLRSRPGPRRRAKCRSARWSCKAMRLSAKAGIVRSRPTTRPLTPRSWRSGNAAARAGDYRLGGATLYVTLEPCPMCAAAMAHARIARLVFGAWDPRQGAAGSAFNLVAAAAMNHRVDAFGGVLSEECGELLRRFFAGRR